MSPDHVVRDFIALQHFDQELARHSPHPRRLNRSELRVDLNDGDRLPSQRWAISLTGNSYSETGRLCVLPSGPTNLARLT
jgi:hypothetical protein